MLLLLGVDVMESGVGDVEEGAVDLAGPVVGRDG